LLHPLSDIFREGRELLASNPSVARLADPRISLSAKLVVVPTMAFWVLAFGDAMALLRRTCGDTDLDELVARHATEDAEHWRWFVEDLVLLASEGIGASSMEEALKIQWGPRTEPVRECAWTLQFLLRKHQDPLVRLAVLEACEHGFEAFMDSMRPVVRASPLYSRLRYLGALHDEAEAGHSLHEADDPFVGANWQSRDVALVQHVVREMYANLNNLHTCYSDSIDKHQLETVS